MVKVHFGFIPKDEEDEKSFIGEFRRHKVEVDVFNKPGFWLSNGKVGFCHEGRDINLGELDLVFLRTVNPAYSGFSPENREFMTDVVRIVESDGVPVVNRVDAIIKANKKHVTQHLLEKKGVKMPSSFSTSDPDRALSELDKSGRHVIKPTLGSGGLGIISTSEKSTAGDVLGLYGREMKPFILQEYVENPGRDIRLIVVGGEVLGGIYRYAPEGIKKCGVTLGGKPEEMKPDKELRELALKSSRALGLEIAGVDVIEGKEGYLVLEVNASPAFDGFMKAARINVPERIVEFLVGEARK